MAKKKNPWIAAVLNFIIWNLGYIYNSRRIVLGIGLLIAAVLLFFGFFIAGLSPTKEIELLATTGGSVVLFGL